MQFDMRNGDVNIRLKFEPRDIWIGVYWNYRRSVESRSRWLDVYICILPLVPIHIAITWGWKLRHKAYEKYCQDQYAKQNAPLDYREWRHNHAGMFSDEPTDKNW